MAVEIWLGCHFESVEGERRADRAPDEAPLAEGFGHLPDSGGDELLGAHIGLEVGAEVEVPLHPGQGVLEPEPDGGAGVVMPEFVSVLYPVPATWLSLQEQEIDGGSGPARPVGWVVPICLTVIAAFGVREEAEGFDEALWSHHFVAV